MASAALFGTLPVGCSSDVPSSTLDAELAATEPSTDPQAETTAVQVAEADEAFRTMSDPDPVAWEAAYKKLQQIGEPALPVLVKGLRSDTLDERVNASSVLAAFGTVAEPVAEDLIAALEDDSMFVRSNVATALLQMPDHVQRVVPVFAEILTGDDAGLRPSAAMNLALIEADQVREFVPQLVTALDDANREVVFHVTQLLGRVGPAAAAAVPKLKAIQQDADEELKTAIRDALLLIAPDGSSE